MKTPYLLITAPVLLAIAVSGCERTNGSHTGIEGQVLSTGTGPASLQVSATPHIAFGNQWNIGGSVSASRDRKFRLPRFANVASVYLDTNRNGTLERFSEPSGDCVLQEDRWVCAVQNRLLTVFRLISESARGYNDKTLIFWEDYDSDGRHRKGSRVCVDDLCTFADKSPFAGSANHDSQVHGISICQGDGFKPTVALVKGSVVSEETITHPPAFEVDVDVVKSANGTSRHLIVASNIRVDRFLAWAGTVDSDGQTLMELFWTSEDDSLAVQQHSGENRFLVTIPPSVTTECLSTPTCEIVIQAVKYWSREGELQHATEIRKSISI